MQLGATCFPCFSIGQHERDLILLNRITESFQCGSIRDVGKDCFDCFELRVSGLSIITSIIVPFLLTIVSLG